jgi:hypothetical protein
MEHHFTCPYCGEQISMVLDLSVRRQTYIEVSTCGQISDYASTRIVVSGEARPSGPLLKPCTEVVMIRNKIPMREEISRRAYALYLMRGCEHGRDVEDWVKATKELSDKPVGESETTTAAHEAASRRADLRSAWPE